MSIYGRQAALRIVREFKTRDEHRNGTLHSRQFPVIVFTGPGGTHELLSLAAFDLNRRSGGYGSLPFPSPEPGPRTRRATLHRA